MADSYFVRIDEERLRANFAAAGEPLTPEAVRAWLDKEGFRLQPNGWWLCEEIDMPILDPSEILQKKRY